MGELEADKKWYGEWISDLMDERTTLEGKITKLDGVLGKDAKIIIDKAHYADNSIKGCTFLEKDAYYYEHDKAGIDCVLGKIGGKIGKDNLTLDDVTSGGWTPDSSYKK